MGRSDAKNATATAGANLRKGKARRAMEKGDSTTDTHTQRAAYVTSKEQEQAHEKKGTYKDRRGEEMKRTSGEGSKDRGREGPEGTEGRKQSSNTGVAHTGR